VVPQGLKARHPLMELYRSAEALPPPKSAGIARIGAAPEGAHHGVVLAVCLKAYPDTSPGASCKVEDQ
jgi:hypothetical protein